MSGFAGRDNRRHPRFLKSFSLAFRIKGVQQIADVSHIKDISAGGLRFTSSHPLALNTQLVLEMGIPQLAPKKSTIEAVVVANHEITPGLFYETRVMFTWMDKDTARALEMIKG